MHHVKYHSLVQASCTLVISLVSDSWTSGEVKFFNGRAQLESTLILLFDEIICSTITSNYSFNFHASRTDRFFQPTIYCMVNAVLVQKNSTHKTISVGLYILYISLNKFLKPSSVFSACSSCWFSWQLVIHQITCSPWTKHHDRSDSFVLRLKNQVYVFFKI